MAPYQDQLGEWYHRPRPIDLRYIDGDPMSRKGTPSEGQRVWLRANGRLPDDPVVHACVVTYASDMTLLDTTVRGAIFTVDGDLAVSVVQEGLARVGTP